VAGNGVFTAKFTARRTDYVAEQWAGDESHAPAGSRGLKVPVG
jgi:hypothetical protein